MYKLTSFTSGSSLKLMVLLTLTLPTLELVAQLISALKLATTPQTSPQRLTSTMLPLTLTQKTFKSSWLVTELQRSPQSLKVSSKTPLSLISSKQLKPRSHQLQTLKATTISLTSEPMKFSQISHLSLSTTHSLVLLKLTQLVGLVLQLEVNSTLQLEQKTQPPLLQSKKEILQPKTSNSNSLTTLLTPSSTLLTTQSQPSTLVLPFKSGLSSLSPLTCSVLPFPKLSPNTEKVFQ